MPELKDKLQEALVAKKGEASEKWNEFDAARKAIKDSGVDLKSVDENSDAFKALDDARKGYSVVKDEVKSLEGQLTTILLADAEADPDAKSVHTFDPERELKAAIVSAGERFTGSAEFKALKDRLKDMPSNVQVGSIFDGIKALEQTEFKTLLTGASDTSGGALFRNDRIPGIYVDLPRRPRVVAELFTVGSTEVDAVDYVELTSRTNSAAETPEAVDADKAAGAATSTAPESAFAMVVKTANVKEITHFIPATKRSLADAGQLATIIDQELSEGVLERIDGQLVNGDGTGETLTGVLNTSGILTQALGADPRTDAVHKAITKLALQFYTPDAVLMHPTDWESLRLQKTGTGDYYYGPPNIAGSPTIWGLPIVVSPVIAQGTALVGAFRRGGTIWNRAGVALSATDSHSDWFLKRIVAVMATARLAFAAQRPKAFCTVTGL